MPVSLSLPAVRQIDKHLKAHQSWKCSGFRIPARGPATSDLLQNGGGGVGGWGQRELVGIEPCSTRLPVRDSGGKAERSRTPRGALEFQPVQDAPGTGSQRSRLEVTEVLADSGSAQIGSSRRMVGLSWAPQAAVLVTPKSPMGWS